MINIQGKYNQAKVFTDLVDEGALEQVKVLCDQEIYKDSKIRMMPDIHKGIGCTIGTTMTIDGAICANLVGVDLNCGMLVVQFEGDLDFEKLDKIIHEKIPSGFSVHADPTFYVEWDKLHDLLNNLKCKDHVDIEYALRSCGSLGGGNHFIEINVDDEGNQYLVIHSGSRKLGLEVANYYQKEAYSGLTKVKPEKRQALIEELKALGRTSEIQTELQKLTESCRKDIPKDLAYCEGDLFEDYIHDIKILAHFADLNRWIMAREILYYMDWEEIDNFTTVHNYIDTDNMIVRKGAVSAQKGEKLIIPINMRDGSIIAIGKGNPDWNYSAPHGAGRLYSRTAAKDLFSVDEYSKSMDGIYTTSISDMTLDECPMAYKPIEAILDNIGDTVEVLKIIKPVYNFKAGEE